MQILPIACAFACAVFHLAAASASVSARSDPVLVHPVIDGDTIDVTSVGRVRLLGIDAPEIGRVFDTPAPFSVQAKDRLSSLVSHRWIRLEQDGETRDAYNRRLAYVFLEDGLFVNAVLVREGLARVTARVRLERLDELKRAEGEAQAFRRGMWGAAPPLPTAGYTAGSSLALPAAPTRKRSARRKPSARHFETSQDRGRDSRRVRVRPAHPRAQQTLLPVQPLADLDLRLLHRARSADI
jgi:micrococcal nuclease